MKLLIRLSSMGDVVLCGAVTGALAPLTFLTRRAWADLAARLPGVARVLVYEELRPPDLRGPWEAVIDLHGNLRSRALCARIPGPVRRLRREDLRRRWRVWTKAGPPPTPVVRRYAEAAGVEPMPRPWLTTPETNRDALGLVPKAAHMTKEWPEERYIELATPFQGPVIVFGGPEEEAALKALARRIGPHAEVVAERGFERTLVALGRCRRVVGGDTGLMHLARALGRPVTVLLGPTTSADGFWSDPDPGLRIVEDPLFCRPCSRHGGPRCPIGDHLCLRGIPADRVRGP